MAFPDEYPGNDCHSCLSTPSPPPPPPLSINQLVALHSRERLLVHPLRWTARQLTLLDCRIHSHGEDARSIAAHEKANADAASSRPDHLTRLLTRRLNLQLSWEELIDTTRRLLRPLGGRISIDDRQAARLYFNRRSRVDIRYGRISVSSRGPAPKIITFACFNHDETDLERRSLFYPPENRFHCMDLPGLYRLHALLKLYTPPDPHKDPFLAAVVIALAQKERRHAPQPEPHSSSFTVRLLFTGEGRPKSMNLYVAHVRAYFLDKLDFPSKEPIVNSSLDIHHWHIPAEPFQTLPLRLCRALTLDCCGETQNVRGQDDSRKMAGKKRKRDW